MSTIAPTSVVTANIGLMLNDHSMARMTLPGIQGRHSENALPGIADECQTTVRYGISSPSFKGRFKSEGWRVVIIHEAVQRDNSYHIITAWRTPLEGYFYNRSPDGERRSNAFYKFSHCATGPHWQLMLVSLQT